MFRPTRYVFAMLLSVGGLAAHAQESALPSKGYLGIHARGNSNVLDELNAFSGITVTRVVENSPAEEAGVKVGDVVLQANGTDLSDANQLLDLVEILPVGSVIRLKIERDREVLNLEAKTVARLDLPERQPEGEARTRIERRRLGFEFSTPGAETNRSLGLAPREGLLVLRISPDSPLRKAGIGEGAVIAQADDRTIHSPEGFLDYLDTRDEAKTIELRFAGKDGRWRDAKVRFHEPERQVGKLSLTPVFSYSREENKNSISILMGLFARERVEAAVKYRMLWLFTFETGATGELLEVE